MNSLKVINKIKYLIGRLNIQEEKKCLWRGDSKEDPPMRFAQGRASI